MRHRPPWMPRLHPEARNKDGSFKREPLSYFYKQLPEQIGFFILREVQGLEDRQVQAYASAVRAETAAWPAPEDGKVRLVSCKMPQINSLIALRFLMATVLEALFTPSLRGRAATCSALFMSTACPSWADLNRSDH